jgi:hypothetical protein
MSTRNMVLLLLVLVVVIFLWRQEEHEVSPTTDTQAFRYWSR